MAICICHHFIYEMGQHGKLCVHPNVINGEHIASQCDTLFNPTVTSSYSNSLFFLLLLHDKPSYMTLKLNLPMSMLSSWQLCAFHVVNVCLEQLGPYHTHIYYQQNTSFRPMIMTLHLQHTVFSNLMSIKCFTQLIDCLVMTHSIILVKKVRDRMKRIQVNCITK